MTSAELQERVSRIKWWHQIDLGNGVVTPGPDKTRERTAQLGLPDDLRGKSVLDIGAWDGAFAFEAERRGASRVLAIDEFIWAGKGWASKEGFDFARQALNSRVEDMLLDVYELSPEKVGMFDLVLFSGVLYHLKHPMLAIERVASVTSSQLILVTHTDLVNIKRPAIAFYPGSECNNDPTNWCGPNIPALEAMLKTAGFKTVQVFAQTPVPPDLSIEDVYPGWATLHAWM